MQLSYLSLKSVVKHLEPNLRIQLSLRSPSFKNCDKICPLRIRELYWDKECLKINRIYYMPIIRRTGILKELRDYQYSNFPASSRLYDHPLAFIELHIGQNAPSAQDVYHRNKKQVIDFLVKRILGGRDVLVQHTYIAADIDAFQPLKRLVTGSLKIYTIDTHKTLETLTTIFHPSTFPLKSLELRERQNFQHPIIQTAQLLVLGSTDNMHLISNRRVHVQYPSSRVGCTLIHHWLEHGKEIGTHFSVEASIFHNGMKANYEIFLKTFEARVSRRSTNPTGFAMKIDNFSEIFISYEKVRARWRLNFKVQKIE